MNNRRTGRSTEMIRRVCRFLEENPLGVALVLCSHQQCALHLSELALYIGVDRSRFIAMTPDRAIQWSAGRRFRVFFDHTVWHWPGSLQEVCDAVLPRSVQ